MNHTPAEIIQALLLALDTPPVTAPGEGDDWSCYISSMPEGGGVPVNAVCVYDTQGEHQSRVSGGSYVVRHGLQIKVRALDYSTGFAKGQAIGEALAQVQRTVVDVTSTNSYSVDVVTQTAPLTALGVSDTGRQEEFTLNFLAMIRAL